MFRLAWTYYAPEEVAAAIEHIDVLVERGTPPDEAAKDAARIYRLRTDDNRTPFVRAHLLTQWRVYRRGGPGTGRGRFRRPPSPGWKPKPSKYPTEVSFRAFFHRLFYE